MLFVIIHHRYHLPLWLPPIIVGFWNLDTFALILQWVMTTKIDSPHLLFIELKGCLYNYIFELVSRSNNLRIPIFFSLCTLQLSVLNHFSPPVNNVPNLIYICSSRHLSTRDTDFLVAYHQIQSVVSNWQLIQEIKTIAAASWQQKEQTSVDRPVDRSPQSRFRSTASWKGIFPRVETLQSVDRPIDRYLQ